MPEFPLLFRYHATQQMILRGITEVEVREALENGEVIESYPDEVPYPSRLVMGWAGPRPIHSTVMDNPAEEVTVIITVYEPDPRRWTDGFRVRRKP